MFQKCALFVQLLCLILQIKADNCTTPDNETGECILLKSCPSLLQMTTNKTLAATEFIRKSICGFEGVDSKVCCGSTSSANNTNGVIEEKQKEKNNKYLLPDKRFCGFQHFDDYGHTTDDIGITESPWLARLGYKYVNEDGTPKSDELLYSCAGSVINTRYILTAATCVTAPEILLVEVQLGEYHIGNETDCIQEFTLEECSDPIKSYQIEKVVPHAGYMPITYENDIALVRLKSVVVYSDYIRPICLPYPGISSANIGDVLIQSGFGFLSINGSTAVVKKRVQSRLISNEECSEDLKDASFFELNDKQVCTKTVENSTQLSCSGDAGAPVTFSHRLQWNQEGIVSYGKGKCGVDFPDVHTRVEKYLDWIEENIEP